MAYGLQAAQYRETQVLTASAGQLVVVLYDHLLVCMRRAQVAVDAGDMERRIELLHRSRLVVGELLATLDHTNGGAIAGGLAGLYTFIMSELMAVGTDADGGRLANVVHIVTELRSAFAQIVGEDTPEAA